jgi:hypothetical protein
LASSSVVIRIFANTDAEIIKNYVLVLCTVNWYSLCLKLEETTCTYRGYTQICKIRSCGESKKKWSPSLSLYMDVYIIFVIESTRIEPFKFSDMVQAWDNSTQLLQPINMYESIIIRAAFIWQTLRKAAVQLHSTWASH